MLIVRLGIEADRVPTGSIKAMHDNAVRANIFTMLERVFGIQSRSICSVYNVRDSGSTVEWIFLLCCENLLQE